MWGWIFAGVFSIIVWAYAGLAGGLSVICVALAIYAQTERTRLAAFIGWMERPDIDKAPDVTGRLGDAYTLTCRLLRDFEKRHAAQEKALERFKAAVNAVPEGLVILDDADRIDWCNPVAEAHFGIDRARVSGQPITSIVRSTTLASYLGSSQQREPLVLRLERGAAQTATLAITVVKFGDKDRLLASRDITRLDVLETTRRDFVANVSHELRTPLTVVLGFLETMQEMKDLPQRARLPIQLAASQAIRMQRLVEELLELSRLESANAPTTEERVDVPALISALHQEALALSSGRHHVSISIDTNAFVLGSSDELRSAFGNLVTNAVRYTPPGGSITLSWQVSDTGGIFCVTDTGIGIEPQHIPRITERFYRVDRSRSRETGGTGLGLAIVKHVASRHRAQLEIDSRVGEGSSFAVTFPTNRIVGEAETQGNKSPGV